MPFFIVPLPPSCPLWVKRLDGLDAIHIYHVSSASSPTSTPALKIQGLLFIDNESRDIEKRMMLMMNQMHLTVTIVLSSPLDVTFIRANFMHDIDLESVGKGGKRGARHSLGPSSSLIRLVTWKIDADMREEGLVLLTLNYPISSHKYRVVGGFYIILLWGKGQIDGRDLAIWAPGNNKQPWKLIMTLTSHPNAVSFIWAGERMSDIRHWLWRVMTFPGNDMSQTLATNQITSHCLSIWGRRHHIISLNYDLFLSVCLLVMSCWFHRWIYGICIASSWIVSRCSVALIVKPPPPQCIVIRTIGFALPPNLTPSSAVAHHGKSLEWGNNPCLYYLYMRMFDGGRVESLFVTHQVKRDSGTLEIW